MTRAQFLARFPNASEAVIRANCTPDRAATSMPARRSATAPKKRASRVPRTRNGGKLSEAGYWGMLRSGLRRLFRFWEPAQIALRAARVPYKGPRGQKWAYRCADCGQLFLRKNVEIDHVDPVGQLTDYAHLGDFVRRLTPEDPGAYRIRCLAHHQAKTSSERQQRAAVKGAPAASGAPSR